MTMLTTEELTAVDAAPASTRVASSSGAYAELTQHSGSETLKVFSTTRQLLFEFDVESGKTRVHIPSGDLEFVTNDGDITFTSARTISLRAHTVQITSRMAIQLAVKDVLGQIRSALSLQSHRAGLSGPVLALAARRGELHVEDAHCAAKTFSARIGYARILAGKLERIADSVIEKAGTLYTTVEGVCQLKAGRMRTLLDGTYHLKAGRAYLRADEDFKVNANKIHLG
jgi:hypothetical protein